VAVEETGGPKIPFRVGRSDQVDGSTSPPDGRLPDADKGSHVATRQHIRDIFYRMGTSSLPFFWKVSHKKKFVISRAFLYYIGFNDQEIVALSGAHAMGRCHTDRSGYWGPWTNAENTFSNEYFRLLVEERWSPKVTHNGKPWEGPDQYENASGNLMMLPRYVGEKEVIVVDASILNGSAFDSDIALIADPEFKKWVEGK
jgi:cytochrome c peroxidase